MIFLNLICLKTNWLPIHLSNISKSKNYRNIAPSAIFHKPMFTERSNRSITWNDLSIGKHKKTIKLKRSRSLSKKKANKSINKSKSSKIIEERPKYSNKRVNSSNNFSPHNKFKPSKKFKSSKTIDKRSKGYVLTDLILGLLRLLPRNPSTRTNQ